VRLEARRAARLIPASRLLRRAERMVLELQGEAREADVGPPVSGHCFDERPEGGPKLASPAGFWLGFRSRP